MNETQRFLYFRIYISPVNFISKEIFQTYIYVITILSFEDVFLCSYLYSFLKKFYLVILGTHSLIRDMYSALLILSLVIVETGVNFFIHIIKKCNLSRKWECGFLNDPGEQLGPSVRATMPFKFKAKKFIFLFNPPVKEPSGDPHRNILLIGNSLRNQYDF